MQNATTTRAKGKLRELKGKAKAGVGKLIGNEQMQIEGRAEATGSKAKQAVAKAGERLRGGAEVLGGATEKRVGAMTGDKGLEAKGTKTGRKGKARQHLNKA
jgi:uncharacterized protein YjbJ (UPF0337 family)